MVALLIGIIGGLALGVLTARASIQRKPVHGGLAHIAHYLGAASVTGALPAALSSLLLGYGVVQAIQFSIGFMLVGLLLLVIYAALEHDAGD